MVKSLKNEKWSELKIKRGALRFRYAVSSSGRIASFTKKVEDGRILNGTEIGGYPTLNIKPDGENRTFYIHKLVAEHFLTKTSKSKVYVIHKNYNKKNNEAKNLRWATKEEMEKHQQGSPLVLKARKARMNQPVYKGHKLTVPVVKQIKTRIFAKNRTQTMSQIARHFKISEMQLYRIKSGENWKHVKV
jgi:hypothetical protein